jgi:hypothetical protein
MEQTFAAKTGELLHDSIQVMFYQVLKPRIRPILAEAFRDVDYAPTSADDLHGATDGDDAGDVDETDLVKARFDRGWGALTRPIKRILTPANFDRLLAYSMGKLSTTLESRIRSYHGRINELGAVRLERDIAGIVSAAVAGGKYGLRDAFVKCTQMMMIMNMEEEEWEEVLGEEEKESGVAWVMDGEERKRVRAIVKERS